eukprot:1232044-Amphidinium_carterae.1
MAFFAHEGDMIQRRFLVAESGLDLVIVTDASTYGIGGVCFDAGTLEHKQYFTDAGCPLGVLSVPSSIEALDAKWPEASHTPQ